jgi:hypothetical protein
MRTILVTALVAFALEAAAMGNTISPGIGLEVAKERLEKSGYEVNTRKHGLAINSPDKNTAVECCRIDDNVTLVIWYDRRSKTVSALSLYFISDGQRSKDAVVREAREIRFEDDGTYTVKLTPKADKPKTPK